MGGGTKTTQKTNETSTTKLPEWMTSAGQDIYSKASQVAKPQAYTGQLAAGMNDNLNAASATAAAGANVGKQNLGAAKWLTGQGTGQVDTINAGMFDTAAAQQYASPYTQQVQQNTLAEMGRQNKMELDGLGDSMAAGKAFGGTRHAVLEAETRKGQSANMQDYLDKSNAAAYEDSAAKWQADRNAKLAADTTNASNQESFFNRLLQAGGQFSNIAGQESALNTESIMNLLRTGGVQQDTENAQKQADYQEFLRMQGAEMNQYQDLKAILSGIPRDVTTTSNGTSTSQQKGSWLNTLLGAGQIAASAFSERRVKRDIELLAVLPNGLGVYSFAYMWDAARRHVGVMVDEVARLLPDALGPRVFGIQTVDYRKLGELA